MKKLLQWLRKFWRREPKLPQGHPEALAEIANKDVYRITKRLYEKAGRNPPGSARNWIVASQGFGPKLCMKQGYESFKYSYYIAEQGLLNQLVPQLRGTTARVELRFQYCLDAENPFGDWGRHIFRIWSE